jgi:hypothetical protein
MWPRSYGLSEVVEVYRPTTVKPAANGTWATNADRGLEVLQHFAAVVVERRGELRVTMASRMPGITTYAASTGSP